MLSFDISDDPPSLPLDALTSHNPTDVTLSVDMFKKSLDADLDPTQRTQLLNLLHTFRSSFDCQQSALTRTSTVAHHIDTNTQAPLRQLPYRVSAPEGGIINEHVDEMLQRGVIRPSQSLWSSPVVLVTKKMGP